MFFSANIDTPFAENASIRKVIHARRGRVDIRFFEKPVKLFGFQAHPQKFGHALQFTSFIGRTLCAFHTMGGEKKLEPGSLKLPNPGGIRPNHHAFKNLHCARGHGLRFPFHFYKTQSA
jgi:hypothetical protein